MHRREEAKAAEVHARCGTRESDWIDPATKRRHEIDRLEVYATTCYGCRELDAAYERLEGHDSSGVILYFGRARPLTEMEDPLGALPPAPKKGDRPLDLENLPDFG